MKLFTILAVPLAVFALLVATPASARNITDWDCGDHVTVSITEATAHQTGLGHLTYSVEIGGLRDPVRDRVTFKLVPWSGYRVLEAYLNGKRCKEIPFGEGPLEPWDAGWTASQAGKPRDANPYSTGSLPFEDWGRGWRAHEAAASSPVEQHPVEQHPVEQHVPPGWLEKLNRERTPTATSRPSHKGISGNRHR